MASSDHELKVEVREFTGTALGDNELDTAIVRAKRHIESRLDTSIDDWYSDQHHEEAIFWTSCLFTKVVGGELDAQDFEAGTVRMRHLHSEEAGTWLKNSERAIETMSAAADVYAFGSTTVTRDDRVYGDDDTGDGGDFV